MGTLTCPKVDPWPDAAHDVYGRTGDRLARMGFPANDLMHGPAGRWAGALPCSPLDDQRVTAMSDENGSTNGTPKVGDESAKPKATVIIDPTNPEAGKGGVVPPVETRFRPGNPGGPGRPRKTDVMKELDKLLHGDGVEGIGPVSKALANKAVEKALQGDFRFYKLICERMYGKTPLTITGADGAPLFEIVKAYGEGVDPDRI